MEPDSATHSSSVAAELYFLITKFLSGGPCSRAAEVLQEELAKNKLLPKRYDWLGNHYDQSFEQLSVQYPHIGSDHLLEVCRRVCPILDREFPPSVQGVTSLLGASRQSLLRGASGPVVRQTHFARYSARRHGVPLADPSDFRSVHNLVRVVEGRRNAGYVTRRLAAGPPLHHRLQLHNRTLGHLSAVYCLLFDQTGQFLFTGADDLLVKVWSAQSGRLLATLRGASSEITDMAVNVENTLLAAGSLDRALRVWCLQTTAPVAVLVAHTGMITGVNFCPGISGEFRYLASTSTDGSVAFWMYTHQAVGCSTVFHTKPIMYNEKMRPGGAQMICASFSPGGTFLAAGSADHHVRIYLMCGPEGPIRIFEVEAHSDRVDSIQWANRGLRFISGSKDGTAHLWQFKRQKWTSQLLDMATSLPGTVVSEEAAKQKPKVSMVSWDRSDRWVVTAVHDSTLKVWDSHSGQLVQVLRGHKDEVFVLEPHPLDSGVMLSAGHDGLVCVWDILRGTALMQHQNVIDGQGHGAVFDAKWCPDGTMFAATDSHGHILVFGMGPGSERLKKLPRELFFHTDYRPLIRDASLGVLDEQTQTAPHLMPPPFLVDVDGCPYSPELQRLVPGREACKVEQLVPNVAFGAEGEQEVLDGLVPDPAPRSNIDHMIQALVNRQYGSQSGSRPAALGGRSASWRSQRDLEGVRLSSGDWEGGSCLPWKARTLLKMLSLRVLRETRERLDAMGSEEMAEYERELKEPEEACPKPQPEEVRSRRLRKGRRNRAAAAQTGYRTRALRNENETEFENPENLELTSSDSRSTVLTDSTAKSEDMRTLTSDSDDSASSEYSDWIADHGVTLEPPKRSRRRPVPRRMSPSPTPPPRKKGARIPQSVVGSEVPYEFQTPKWLSEVAPRKAPYYPQMGDEVMLFQQGYKYYLEAVRSKQVYKVAGRQAIAKLKLPEPALVKVIGIKFEIRPPRLCCLRLAVLDEGGLMSGQFFNIKYHDMADVIDFLVLKQSYDAANARNWKPGDRFRCMIDDSWWEGCIVSKRPHDTDYPDSPFLSFMTRWDNGEDEPMSPWDLEPPDESRRPAEPGGSVPVQPEDTHALYTPRGDEWPRADRDATCRRILASLDKVIELAIAEAFSAPVDLNHYPSYAITVEYPMDLSTIKARLENRFYRRLTAVQFDVRYIATNAEKFNEPHSQIVKQARIVSDLCLRIIQDRIETDVGAVYHQLADTYHSSPSEDDSGANSEDAEVDPEQPGPSSGARSTRSKMGGRLRRKENDANANWRVACHKLLREMYDKPDSLPFREPVDTLEHPDYLQVIDTPMDLGTVAEELKAGNYQSPRDFYKDVRLIFANSKNYNTNQRSRIFSMTVRLSNMFEARMRQIMVQWKATRRKLILEEIKSRKVRQQKKSAVAEAALSAAGPSGLQRAADPLEAAASSPASSSSDIESEDQMDEHLKLSTLRNNFLKQNAAAQINGHSYAKPEPQVPRIEDEASETEGEAETETEARQGDGRYMNTNREDESDDGEEEEGDNDSSDEGSEDSYKPNGRANPPSKVRTRNRGRQKVRYRDGEDSKSSAESESSGSDSSSASDSESSGESASSEAMPTRRLPRGKRRRGRVKSDSSDSSSRRQTRSRKTARLTVTARQTRSSDSSDVEAPSYTVSSRGRVRKLTERARALLGQE